MGNTPRRSIRVDDETWEAWRVVADDYDLTVSDLIRRAVDAFVAGADGPLRALLADDPRVDAILGRQEHPAADDLRRQDVTPIFRDERKGRL